MLPDYFPWQAGEFEWEGWWYGQNFGASRQPDEPAHADCEGGRSVWYQWTAPAYGYVWFDTYNSDFDTVLAVYTGAGLDDFVEVASNDDYSDDYWSAVEFTAQPGTTYYIVVDGYDGAEYGEFQLYAWLEAPGDLTNDNFADAAAFPWSGYYEYEGDTWYWAEAEGYTFGATSETGEPEHADNAGGASVWYAWTPAYSGYAWIDTYDSEFDTLLAVYTGTSVSSLTEVASNDDDGEDGTSAVEFDAVAGTTYYIVVDGYDGEMGYYEVGIDQVLDATPTAPANDDFAGAVVVDSDSATFAGSNLGATMEDGEPEHDDGDGDGSVWYVWTPDDSQNVVIDTVGSSLDTVLAVYTGGAVDGLTEIVANDDYVGYASLVTFVAAARTSYYIAVCGYSGERGAYVLNVNYTPPAGPANDHFENAIVIAGDGATESGSNEGATLQFDEPQHDDGDGAASVWYMWTPSSACAANINTLGSDFDTVLVVYTGDSLDTLEEVASNDDDEGLTSSVYFTAEAGTGYYIAVCGYEGDEGTYILNVGPLPPPANDDLADAAPLGGITGAFIGTTLNATAEPDEPDHAGEPANASVWYRWTPPVTGIATLELTGSDVWMGVYTRLTVAQSGLVDVASGTMVYFIAQAGTTYYIAIDGSAEVGGYFILYSNLDHWGNGSVPPNDKFADASPIYGLMSAHSGRNIGAGREVGEPNHAGNAGGASVWYTFTPPQDGWFYIESYGVDSSGFDLDTLLAIYTGNSVDQLTEVASCDDGYLGWLYSRLEVPLTGGTTYWIAVDGYDGIQGDLAIFTEFIAQDIGGGGDGNTPPVAVADAYNTTRIATLNVAAPGVLDNDLDSNGDPLTAQLVAGPASGTLTFNADGSFQWVPALDSPDTVTFTYTAHDGEAASAPATVTITVDNLPPVAVDDMYAGTRAAPLVVPAPGVLDNDTDTDNDALTGELLAGPASGTLAFNADGSFAWTPAEDSPAIVTFTYRADDGEATSDPATVTITLGNAPPVANADAYATVANQPLLIGELAGILANDVDLDGDPLDARLTGATAHGSVSLNADGSFYYVPDSSYVGNDTFTYKADDGQARSASATVTIAVQDTSRRVALTGVGNDLAIGLEAVGNEKSVAFSLWFDPTEATWNAPVAPAQAGDWTVDYDDSQVALGRVGVTITAHGAAFPAESLTLATLDFTLTGAAGAYVPVEIGDLPVARQAVDIAAQPITAIGWMGGELQNGTPTYLMYRLSLKGTTLDDGRLKESANGWLVVEILDGNVAGKVAALLEDGDGGYTVEYWHYEAMEALMLDAGKTSLVTYLTLPQPLVGDNDDVLTFILRVLSGKAKPTMVGEREINVAKQFAGVVVGGRDKGTGDWAYSEMAAKARFDKVATADLNQADPATLDAVIAVLMAGDRARVAGGLRAADGIRAAIERDGADPVVFNLALRGKCYGDGAQTAVKLDGWLVLDPATNEIQSVLTWKERDDDGLKAYYDILNVSAETQSITQTFSDGKSDWFTIGYLETGVEADGVEALLMVGKDAGDGYAPSLKGTYFATETLEGDRVEYEILRAKARVDRRKTEAAVGKTVAEVIALLVEELPEDYEED